MGFYTPGLGRSTTNDWNVEGGHMAERCSLFIIIVGLSYLEWRRRVAAALTGEEAGSDT